MSHFVNDIKSDNDVYIYTILQSNISYYYVNIMIDIVIRLIVWIWNCKTALSYESLKLDSAQLKR